MDFQDIWSTHIPKKLNATFQYQMSDPLDDLLLVISYPSFLF